MYFVGQCNSLCNDVILIQKPTGDQSLNWVSDELSHQVRPQCASGRNNRECLLDKVPAICGPKGTSDPLNEISV
jgi:hypothetical protein